jgi:hypothetical protein
MFYVLMKAISPFSGKPMRVVYEPDVWTFRGEKYPYMHIAFRDDEAFSLAAL